MGNTEAWKEKYLNELIDNQKVNLDNYPELPATLYKYVSLSGDSNNELDNIKLKTLENNELFIACNLNFNDPYDCAINMDISKEIRATFETICSKELTKGFSRENRRKTQSKMFKSQLQQLLKESSKEADKLTVEMQQDWEHFRETLGVCCLSGYYNSELMWSHYTNAYKGFCIGYDTHELSKCTPLLPIIYSKEVTSFKDYINFDTTNWMYKNPNYKLIGIHCITKKSPVWKYENEWRIVNTIKGCGENIKVPVPSKLYIGCRMDDAQKKKLICIAKKLHIPKIYEIVLNPEEFELKRNPIC